jgi:hypothetical protein
MMSAEEESFNSLPQSVNNSTTAAMGSEKDEGTAWGKDAIILSVVLPIILLTLVGIAMRFCIISNRRHAFMHERRQNIRALERAQIRENKRLAEKRKKKRLKEIDDALICKVASKCKCNKLNRRKTWSAELDITMHTNATDDMSVASASSTHDDCERDDPIDDSDDAVHETSVGQTCAVCLEQYIPGKDRVSWSKYQTCSHAFHRKCIEVWLAEVDRDGSCPCCRGPYLKVATRTEENTEDAENSINAEITSGDDAQVDIESNAGTDIDETAFSHLTSKETGLDFVSFCLTHGLKSIKE